jgi:hypothetical protein
MISLELTITSRDTEASKEEIRRFLAVPALQWVVFRVKGKWLPAGSTLDC